jgi:hypothetical protein
MERNKTMFPNSQFKGPVINAKLKSTAQVANMTDEA